MIHIGTCLLCQIHVKYTKLVLIFYLCQSVFYTVKLFPFISLHVAGEVYKPWHCLEVLRHVWSTAKLWDLGNFYMLPFLRIESRHVNKWLYILTYDVTVTSRFISRDKFRSGSKICNACTSCFSIYCATCLRWFVFIFFR